MPLTQTNVQSLLNKMLVTTTAEQVENPGKFQFMNTKCLLL